MYNIEALARGSEGRTITEFARHNGLSLNSVDDWSDAAIKAIVSGCRLDSINGTAVISDDGIISDEYLVHLIGRRANCVLNLSVILAMATAYCLDRQQLAETARLNGAAKVTRDHTGHTGKGRKRGKSKQVAGRSK